MSKCFPVSVNTHNVLAISYRYLKGAYGCPMPKGQAPVVIPFTSHFCPDLSFVPQSHLAPALCTCLT